MTGTVVRATVGLINFPGALGVNVLHFALPGRGEPTQTQIDDLNDALEAAYGAVSGSLVLGMQAIVVPEFELVDETGSILEGVMTPTTPAAAVTGTAEGYTSRATQMNMRLYTSAIRAGRRVRGRIFLGPIGNAAIASDGSIDPADAGAANTAFTALLGTELALGVYCRARPEVGGGFIGAFYEASAVEVQDLPGVLRSRRDS